VFCPARRPLLSMRAAARTVPISRLRVFTGQGIVIEKSKHPFIPPTRLKFDSFTLHSISCRQGIQPILSPLLSTFLLPIGIYCPCQKPKESGSEGRHTPLVFSRILSATGVLGLPGCIQWDNRLLDASRKGWMRKGRPEDVPYIGC